LALANTNGTDGSRAAMARAVSSEAGSVTKSRTTGEDTVLPNRDHRKEMGAPGEDPRGGGGIGLLDLDLGLG
jgi:hypothetical protein